MSIKSILHKFTDWYENLIFLKKILYVYIACAALPIVCILIYYYINTTSLLEEQAYADISRNMILMESGLDTALKPYQTVLENLKNDKELNTQLNVDYTELSLCELAHYLEAHVDTLSVIYPYIDSIHFYTSNETLPDDGYYFYELDKLNQNLRDGVADSEDKVLLTWREDDEGSRLSIISEMNYYATDRMTHYVELVVSEELISSLMSYEDSHYSIFLLDQDGRILYGPDSECKGLSIDERYPGWTSLTHESDNSVKPLGNDTICMENTLSMGLSLFMVYDRTEILKQVRSVPLLLSFVFAFITFLLFMLILAQSRTMNQRLHGILDMLKRIGNGDFSYRLEPKGHAEFGQIENALNETDQQIEALIRDNYQKQLIAKNSELNLLQEQINPHFLYNALGVINSLAIREGAKASAKSIRYLAGFYRISLNKGRNCITIAEEVELLKNYMEIQLLRFSDLVEIYYDIDENITGYYTIKLLLQPLVENAIHHAREEETFLTIRVHGHLMEKDTDETAGQRICLEVEDNGLGIDDEKLEILRKELSSQEEGFGLKNVDRRVKLAYGNAYGLSIFSKRGQGTRIRIEIPVQITRNQERKNA